MLSYDIYFFALINKLNTSVIKIQSFLMIEEIFLKIFLFFFIYKNNFIRLVKFKSRYIVKYKYILGYHKSIANTHLAFLLDL